MSDGARRVSRSALSASPGWLSSPFPAARRKVRETSCWSRSTRSARTTWAAMATIGRHRPRIDALAERRDTLRTRDGVVAVDGSVPRVPVHRASIPSSTVPTRSQRRVGDAAERVIPSIRIADDPRRGARRRGVRDCGLRRRTPVSCIAACNSTRASRSTTPSEHPAATLNERVFDWLDDPPRATLLPVHQLHGRTLALQHAPAPESDRARRHRETATSPRCLFQAVMPGDGKLRPPGSPNASSLSTTPANRPRRRGRRRAGRSSRQQLDLDADTLLVVTSDHGEYFGEHGLVGHSKDVYQPAIARAADREVAESIGEGLGLPRPCRLPMLRNLIASELDAGSRRVEWSAQRFPRAYPGRRCVAENHYSRARDMMNPAWNKPGFQRVRRAIYDWPLKYVASSDGANELYDLAKATPTSTVHSDRRATRGRDVGSRRRLRARLATSPGSDRRSCPGADRRRAPGAARAWLCRLSRGASSKRSRLALPSWARSQRFRSRPPP